MTIVLARSLAGHDKDEVYVIIGEEGDILLLANGKNRTLDHPKKKKRKHLQPIRSLPKAVLDLAEDSLSDIKIKEILKTYHISLESKEN